MGPVRAAPALLILIVGCFAQASAGAAESGPGSEAFAPCRACHSLDRDAGPMPGPNLAGLIGRPVAGDEAFDYSQVLREARANGLVWDLPRLDAFLQDPEGMFPGMWMSYPGIVDAAEREALSDYIGAAD